MTTPPISHAKRGVDWELALEHSFAALPGSSIVKTDAPVQVLKMGKKAGLRPGQFIGYFKKGGQLDFEGGYQGQHCALDAKSTRQERFNFKAINTSQQLRMERTWLTGGLSGLLLRFQGDDNLESDHLFAVGYEYLADRWAHGKKSTTLPELEAQVEHGAPAVVRLEYGVLVGQVYVRSLDLFLMALKARRGS